MLSCSLTMSCSSATTSCSCSRSVRVASSASTATIIRALAWRAIVATREKFVPSSHCAQRPIVIASKLAHQSSSQQFTSSSGADSRSTSARVFRAYARADSLRARSFARSSSTSVFSARCCRLCRTNALAISLEELRRGRVCTQRGPHVRGLGNRWLHLGLLEQLLLERLELHVRDRPCFEQLAPALQAGQHWAPPSLRRPPSRRRTAADAQTHPGSSVTAHRFALPRSSAQIRD